MSKSRAKRSHSSKRHKKEKHSSHHSSKRKSKSKSRPSKKQKHHTEKHHKSKRNRRRSRSAKNTKSLGPEPTYAISDEKGNPIEKYKEYESKSHTPSRAASRLARNHLLHKTDPDKVKFCMRQKSRGKGHNKVLCYEVTQSFGEYKKNDFMVKMGFKKEGDSKKIVRVKSNRG
jgi:hypothetical protein